jgi:hypothetical protein
MTGPENLPVADCNGDRPWPQIAVVRRDCVPHRGNLLTFLSSVALVCGVLSFFLGVPAFLGLVLAFVTKHIADDDLTRMCQGSLDPGGHGPTFEALCRAERAVHLNACGLVLFPFVWCGGSIVGAAILYALH